MAHTVKNIGGRELGFKFTLLTITKYCEIRGIDFSDYDKDMAENFNVSSNVLFRAAVDVYSQGKVKLSEYEMDDLFEQMTNEDYTDLMEAYHEGMMSALGKMGAKSSGKQDAKKK